MSSKRYPEEFPQLDIAGQHHETAGDLACCRLHDGAVAAFDLDGRRIFEDLHSGSVRRSGQAETIFQGMEVAGLRIEGPCTEAFAGDPVAHLGFE